MTKSNLLSAFVGGAAAGAVIGLLFAPQTGAETRNKILKAKDKSLASMDDMIEEGKKSWYTAKGKAEANVGIAAEEVDDFMRHVLGKGEKMWRKAKNKAGEMADDATTAAANTYERGRSSMENSFEKGKSAAERLGNEARRTSNDIKEQRNS